MKKIIYHGSDHIIEQPEFGYGKPYNDYGIGFYCTENPNMAKEWGVGIDHNGYANQYQINCDGLSILDLHASEYTDHLSGGGFALRQNTVGGQICHERLSFCTIPGNQPFHTREIEAAQRSVCFLKQIASLIFQGALHCLTGDRK